MAFLLIVQVPYERDDENKLEQEIRKLSTDVTADDFKSDDETESGKDGELGEQSTVEDDSSGDKIDKEESQDKTADEEKAETNESIESALEGTDDEKQEVKNDKKELESKDDNANKPESSESNPKENDNSQEVNETKQVENKTIDGTNTKENSDKKDEEPESTDKPQDENQETVNDSTSSKDQGNVTETSSKEQDNVAESVSSNKPDSSNEASSTEPDKEEVKNNEESSPENKQDEGDDKVADSDTKPEDDKKYHDCLTPLLPVLPLYKIAEDVLISLEVDNYEMTLLGKKTEKYIRFSFIEQDSLRCETILNKLKAHGVGREQGSSVSVFPASLHECIEDNSQSSPEGQQVLSAEQQQEESQFKKSIKSRLVVAQVVASVRSNAMFTFDYLLLLILASVIACLGLAENSSVVLVASMLISPLMGPILAGTFGQVIKVQDLRNLGVKSELIGLSLCVVVGFLFGLITGGIGLHGALWGSTEEWPTAEMKSRGLLRSLWVGVCIALPSGAGVAISVLGGNAGSLVGVAISASLLPPACNAGMLWAYAFLAALSPPSVIENSVIASTTVPTNSTTLSNTTTSTQSIITSTVSQLLEGSSVPENCLPLVNNAYRQVYSCNVANDAALLGLISLLLTLLNITCILIMGIIVLKIKEVAPHTAGSNSSVDNFWEEDIKVARTYYQTSKGPQSNELGHQFLQEWQKIKGKDKNGMKANEKLDNIEEENEDEFNEDNVSLSGQMETINIFNYITEVENSSTIQHVLSRLSPSTPQAPVSSGLFNIYSQATADVEHKLSRRPAVYLAEAKVKDKLVNNVYHTIHGPADKRHKPTLTEMRNRLTRPTQSMYFDGSTVEMINESQSRDSGFSMGLAHPDSSTSGLLKRRRKKVKFEVTKVEEQALLP